MGDNSKSHWGPEVVSAGAETHGECRLGQAEMPQLQLVPPKGLTLLVVSWRKDDISALDGSVDRDTGEVTLGPRCPSSTGEVRVATPPVGLNFSDWNTERSCGRQW